MSDLISRQDALDAFNDNIMVTGRENANEVRSYIKETMDKIKALPSADRPTGTWENKGMPWKECSICGWGAYERHRYCPNCGARMGGDNK